MKWFIFQVKRLPLHWRKLLYNYFQDFYSFRLSNILIISFSLFGILQIFCKNLLRLYFLQKIFHYFFLNSITIQNVAIKVLLIETWYIEHKTLKGTWDQSNDFCLNWSFLIIQQNCLNQNFKTFTCEATTGILCMFIRVYDITYVETQSYHSKLFNFISLWEMVKTTIKLCKRFFFQKLIL